MVWFVIPLILILLMFVFMVALAGGLWFFLKLGIATLAGIILLMMTVFFYGTKKIKDKWILIVLIAVSLILIFFGKFTILTMINTIT